jgi:PAS domain S-box-containing protein
MGFDDRKERYKHLVENFDDLIFELDGTGVIRYANQAALNFLGRSEIEASNLMFDKIIDPDYQEKTDYIFSQREGKQYRFECPLINGDGLSIWMSHRVFFMTEGTKPITRILCRDIYGRKNYERNLKEALDSLKVLTQSLLTGILYETADHRIIFVNKTFCEIFKIQEEPDKLRDATIDLNDDYFKNQVSNKLRYVSDITEYPIKKERVTGKRVDFRNGKIFERDYIPLVEDGKLKNNIWIYKDITERILSEQKFKGIFENSSIPILLLDEKGIVDANHETVKLLSANSKKEILGIDPFKLSPEVQPDGIYSDAKIPELKEKIKEHPKYVFEWAHEDLRGTEFVVEATISKIEINKKPLFLCVWQDHTERKQQEKRLLDKQNELQAFVGAAPAAIAMFDNDMNYLAVSEKWLDDYKLKGKKVIGQNHYELFPDIQEEWKLIHKRCLKGAIEREDEDVAYHKDGTFDWIRWEVRPWFDVNYEIGGIIIMTESISRQKKQEEELRIAKKKAEEASEAKAHFLSAMSHEIRTPMNAVVGMTHILLQENPLPQQIENLKTLQFAADNLLALINDILDFNKIEAGKISIEEVDFSLKELVQGINSTFSFKAKDNDISLEVEYDDRIPPFVIGDPVRIGQILTNLAGNAIKFTEEGFVKIKVEQKKIADGLIDVFFAVEDSGIGIAKDKQEIIFERFSQAETETTRKFGGTGLGLAITKKLLELLGSEIELNSEPGEGSTFYFTLQLPISTKKIDLSENGENGQLNESDLRGTRVLLVEDNDINRIVASKFLKNWKAEVDYAENGAVAVEKVIAGDYDIILMDLQMPVMDGYEATTKIRGLEDVHKAGVPIAALTASAMLEIKEKVFKVGMNEYISKPFVPNELFRKIRRLTDHEHLRKEAVAQTEKNRTMEKKGKLMNFDKITELAAGSNEFVVELIDSYLSSLEEFREEFSSSFENLDLDQYRKITHKIKASIKFLEVQTLEEEIEKTKKVFADKPKDSSVFEAHSKQMNAIVDQVVEQLKAERKRFS